jgi:surfactin synthase thioesterase subunit
MRTDLRLLNNYTYAKEQALDVPMVIIYGAEDERVKADQAEKWRDETFSSCHIIQRGGGHRYIDHDGEFLTSLIQSEVVVPVIIRKTIDGAL